MSGWTSWSEEIVHDHVPIYSPSDRGDLQEMVRHAAEQHGHVRVVGSGHSWRHLSLAEGGAVVLTDQLDRILEVDEDESTVTVEGGAVLHDVAAELFERGFSLPTMGDTDRQSVAGAISTDTHGSGRELHGLGEYVTAMTLVLADGSLHEVPDAELPAARVSLGRLGAVHSVTLEVEPTIWLDHERRTVPFDEDEVEALDDLLEDHRHVEYWYLPYTDFADRIVRTERSDPVDPIPDYGDENEKMAEQALRLDEIGREDPAALPRIFRLSARFRELFGDEDREGPAHTILPLVSQSTVDLLKTHTMECLLPYEDLWDGFLALRESLEAAADADVYASIPIHIRFVKRSSSFLSPYVDPLNASFSVNFSRNYEGAHVWFRDLENRMRDLGGRTHVGKISYHPTPVDPRFEEVRARLDPDGVFSNPDTVYPTPASKEPLEP